MTDTTITDDVWLTTNQAAERAQRHPVTIRVHAAAGTLKSTQAGRGRGRRYRPEWVDEWVKASRGLPSKAAS